MIQCAIIGATGFTGIELVKILLGHPQVSISMLTTRLEEPPDLRLLFPELSGNSSLRLEKFNFKEVLRRSDIIFCCLPHTEAQETVAQFYKNGKIVIDLSADFRLKDAKLYQTCYQDKHTNKELLKVAVYGLPEIYRRAIRSSNLIANPGCYSTGAILGLKPLLEGGLIEVDDIVIDAKSGMSGAGRKMTITTFFGEVNENFKAYKVNAHQHMPEMQMVLRDIARGEVKLTFVPHLLPIDRGILSSIYVIKKKGVKRKEVLNAFHESFQSEPFVRIKKEREFPALRDVQRTNYCDIGIWAEDRSDRVIVITAIDNLVKGASGQAVQNMNIRCGFPEEAGLAFSR